VDGIDVEEDPKDYLRKGIRVGSHPSVQNADFGTLREKSITLDQIK